MIRTPSPEGIEEVLDSFDYSIEYLSYSRFPNSQDHFTLNDYEKVIKTLLDWFWPGYDYTYPVDNTIDHSNRGVLIANSHMLNKWHNNCKVITFNSLYPNTIIKLYEEGTLQFNVKEFGELYKALYQARYSFKEKGSSKRNIIFLKVLINFAYGALSSQKWQKYIGCNDHTLIPGYMTDVLKTLAIWDPNNIIYVDTDQIYLYEMTNFIRGKLDSMDLAYEIGDVHKMLLINKKKYIIIDSYGNVQNKGIRDFKR